MEGIFYEYGCVQGSPVHIRYRAEAGRPVIGHSYCAAIFDNLVHRLQRLTVLGLK